MPEQDERTMAMLIYLTSFLTTLVGPLLIWLLKKDESAFVDHHGREYLNFLISITIYLIISGLLALVLIGILLLIVIGIGAFILTIIAAVKAYNGEYYRFPFTIRFL
ncbi:hypothetical protein SAMN05421736_11220 [Evansella caseinilytica]|uniref:Tic20 family protein n=1 Tax=Evansella caseinilytica TaxID=1503961 RepID=A0A1H3STD1_9BACI|nr:DUF4870 domain-containing protein [Evansella caseinilytica]SDZ41194.1 hypothetical protein SAMN05421736_11220 [Evansella caseinilytica]